MALDPVTVGAAVALTGGAATRAEEAASAATSAAERANMAAEGAEAYASQYDTIHKNDKLDNADIRLMYSQFQAHIRYLEKRVTTLENQVAAMAGK